MDDVKCLITEKK